MTSELWAPGSVVLEEFHVERRLGEGGFGAVVLVRSNRTGERFAVKRSRVSDPLGRARAIAELQQWIALPAHENLAACRFVRTVGDDVAIFAEYVPGGSLADRVRTGRLYEGGPGPALERILDIAVQTARGLHALHLLGLVHGDVKAANVLLTENGVAKVADFGLAARARMLAKDARIAEAVYGDRLTAEWRDRTEAELAAGDDPASAPGGTFAYVSPEQLAGRRLNRHSDMWSWGVTLLEMFSGGVTWRSGTLAEGVLALRLGEPAPAPVPAIPARVGELLETCFREEPDDRWASLQQVSRMLAQIYRHECGRDYPRPEPRDPGLAEVLDAARVGESAGDPQGSNFRQWIRIAAETQGIDPAELAARPIPPGTRRAQLVAELAELEEARRMLAETSGPAFAWLCAEIAWAHWGLGDAAGAVREFERSIGLVENVDDAEARHVLAVALWRLIPLLRRLGRRDQERAMCDRYVQVCEMLPDKRMLVTALSLKAKANGDDEQYERALRLAEEIGDGEIQAEVLSSRAVTLGELGRAAEAMSALGRADELLAGLVGQGRDDLRLFLGMTRLNRGLAGEAVEILSALVEREGRHEYTGELGAAYLSAGFGQEQAGRVREAREFYARARRLLQAAVIQDGRSDLADRLGEALDFESTLVRELGDPPAAVALAEQAVELWQNLVRSEGERVWGLQLARATCTLGKNLQAAGQIEPAIDRLREAAGLLRAAEPGSLLTATTLMNLGSALREADDLDEAVNTLQEALDIAAPLDDPEGRHGTALILNNLSNALEDAGEPVGSFAALDRARTLLEELTRAGHTRWRLDLARVYQNLTAKLLEMESFELAKEFAHEGVTLYEELIGGQGRDDLITGMAKLLLGAGRAHKRLFELGEAIACFDRALAMLARAPSTPERQSLAGVISRVVGLYRPLLQATPDQFESWAELADTLVAQAQDLAEAGDNDGACNELAEPIEIYRFLADAADDPAYLELCAQTCFLKALAALNAHRPYAADQALVQTVSLTETLMREHGRTDLLEHWADAQIARASHLASWGDVDGADDVADETKDYLRAHHAGEHDRLAAAIDAAIAEHASPAALPSGDGKDAASDGAPS